MKILLRECALETLAAYSYLTSHYCPNPSFALHNAERTTTVSNSACEPLLNVSE